MNTLLWKARCRILTEPRSLKEKRSVIKSALQKMRNTFPVSVAEVGSHDTLNVLEFGLAAVSPQSRDLEGLAQKIRSFLERDFPLEVFDEDLEISPF